MGELRQGVEIRQALAREAHDPALAVDLAARDGAWAKAGGKAPEPHATHATHATDPRTPRTRLRTSFAPRRSLQHRACRSHPGASGR